MTWTTGIITQNAEKFQYTRHHIITGFDMHIHSQVAKLLNIRSTQHLAYSPATADDSLQQ